MKHRFRVAVVGRKWIYGYIGKENGVFHLPAKIQKEKFPKNQQPKLDDLFVFHNTTATIGRRITPAPHRAAKNKILWETQQT